ncbi:MAG: hypothetical protein IKC35_01310, partial [Clostridia bacterium]|nr:hypothetical protein [Clostridia bacterium]
MVQFDVYQFVLCLIVFLLLTGIFTTLTVWIIRLNAKLITSGVNDDKIKEEYLKEQAKKQSIVSKIMDKLLFAFCLAVILVAFVFSLSVTFNEGKVVGNVPIINVVKSNSMSYVNENHRYLDEGEVTNQIQMFDLVFINQLPNEEDLKINDIVVYETDGIYVIHRIVAINEPDSSHPNERYFLLQGDANETADRFPVRYSQMKGIYSGKRIPFVGSFVVFMQSPAGYLCILLIIFAVVGVAVAEKRLKAITLERLVAMGLIKADDQPNAPEQLEQKASDNTSSLHQDTDQAYTQSIEKAEPVQSESIFARFGKGKTFAQKLEGATEPLISRYCEICSFLSRIKNVRAIR